MKNAAGGLLLVVLVLGSVATADGQEPVRSSLGFPVEDFRLRNGLRVILSIDARLPLVTVAVGYGAGTIREKPGQEGLAYLLENLMFQGSENVGPLQHVGFVQKVGGELNATTTLDKALFYETLPSNYLALALWLESDRMKSLSITAAAIERTRAELVQEHRGRLASDPYRASFDQFDALLFPDFPYGHPLIGAGQEMMGLTEADVVAFHRAHYVPNNAVLSIVGDIDPVRTKELVTRYFDSIPPGPDVPAMARPEFKRESEAVVRFAAIPLPTAGFHMGFRFYPLQPGELDALRILEYLLFEGETARLRNRLLRRDLTAQYLSVVLDERLRVAGLKIFCLNTNDILVERSQKIILSEIDKLRTNTVSQDELNKARRRYKLDYIDRLSTLRGKALFLIGAAFAGTAMASLGQELENALRVEPAALLAFVSKYFTPQNRVVLELGPQ
jgi:predicted Zn-dependent peptidase